MLAKVVLERKFHSREKGKAVKRTIKNGVYDSTYYWKLNMETCSEEPETELSKIESVAYNLQGTLTKVMLE